MVQTMPTPLSDAMSASKLNPEKTEAALQTVSTIYVQISRSVRVTTDMKNALAIRSHRGVV